MKNVSLAYGHYPLLSSANLSVSQGDRICLLGRNGVGKSNLLNVIAGQTLIDEGEVWRRDNLRIAMLQQDVPGDLQSTVYDIVSSGLGELGRLLREHHELASSAAEDRGTRISEIQNRIDSLQGWNISQKVEAVIDRLSLNADALLGECSGGIRRRVLLAKALVSEPDLLLLDEPTNHMDIESIIWLEEFLVNFSGAIVFVTHDRTLIKNLALQIIELDRGTLSQFPGNYDKYLSRKLKQLEDEEKSNSKFDKRLSEHEIWIRQGIKARRSRNEGRVRKLQSMRMERQRRLERTSAKSMEIEHGELSGKLVVELRDVSFAYENNTIISNFSTRIMRGDRIGIIGPNGCGKSTLLQLLLGQIKPVDGWISQGTKLSTAYFDQQRVQLDMEKSVIDNMNSGSETITINGKSRHIISYLNDFLFPAERIRSPVKSLSGGERNRLLLARIFSKPANILILDEPTNDLDIETLELLEELLSEYQGTLLLVSHDRTFIDRIVTSTIVFEGDGKLGEYVGGYADHVKQKPSAAIRKNIETEKNSSKKSRKIKVKNKLSYTEQRELDAIPEEIEKLETLIHALEEESSRPEFYKGEEKHIRETLSLLNDYQTKLNHYFERWEKLDSFKTTMSGE